MDSADKSTLRLAIGLGIAVLIAYGSALPLPFAVCVMTTLLLCKPGPPMPIGKGIVLALMVAALLTAGIVMVPLLENYAFAGIALTALILYGIFVFGLRRGGAVSVILAMAFVLIPVAGVADQSLVGILSVTIAIGVLTGVLAGVIANALFADAPATAQPAVNSPMAPDSVRWVALRAMLIVIPVFILALTNPSFYLAAIMKTVALSQQAEGTNARDAGQELVGSTVMGALIGAVLWMGLSLLPNLWMLTLWLMLAALWAGSGAFAIRRSAYPPSFWSNALITALILLGPAIEDSANGKSVLQASVVRCGLFIGVACYAWGTVWALERWRASKPAREVHEPTGA